MSDDQFTRIQALYWMFKHARKWQPEIEQWGDGQSIVLRLDGNYFDRSPEEMQEILDFWRDMHQEATKVVAKMVEAATKWEEAAL